MKMKFSWVIKKLGMKLKSFESTRKYLKINSTGKDFFFGFKKKKSQNMRS